MSYRPNNIPPYPENGDAQDTETDQPISSAKSQGPYQERGQDNRRQSIESTPMDGSEDIDREQPNSSEQNT